MTSGIAFLAGIALSLGVSIAIIHLLRPVLEDLLVDFCGTIRRAAFWSRFSQIMLVISPLLTTTLLTTPEMSAGSVVPLFRETLFNILLGTFAALGAVGLLLWKSIPFSEATPDNSREHSS